MLLLMTTKNRKEKKGKESEDNHHDEGNSLDCLLSKKGTTRLLSPTPSDCTCMQRAFIPQGEAGLGRGGLCPSVPSLTLSTIHRADILIAKVT